MYSILCSNKILSLSIGKLSYFFRPRISSSVTRRFLFVRNTYVRVCACKFLQKSSGDPYKTTSIRNLSVSFCFL